MSSADFEGDLDKPSGEAAGDGQDNDSLASKAVEGAQQLAALAHLVAATEF